MSAGSPDRFNGCASAKASFINSADAAACSPSKPMPRPKISVAMPPGQMALTRIPNSPNSTAVVRDTWMTPDLAAL